MTKDKDMLKDIFQKSITEMIWKVFVKAAYH